jgi:hypothetical protein
MRRTHAPTGLAVALALAAATAHAQQPLPAPRVVAGTGPGQQPQLNTSPYQTVSPGAASRGVNPFAAPPAYMSFQPATRFGPRFAPPPAVVVLPAAPAVPPLNNPAAFNPGFVPPLPVVVPPLAPVAPVLPVGFNPLFVARPAVVSAYYVPPVAARQPGTFRYTGPDERVNPWSGSVHQPAAGVATLADGSTFYRVPGVGPNMPDTAGTGLYFNPDAGTYFNPASGLVVRPGGVRFLPWLW